MHVDEERVRSILSDHNLIEIRVDVGASRPVKRRRKEIITTNYEKAAALIREYLQGELAVTAEISYDQLINALKENAERCTQR